MEVRAGGEKTDKMYKVYSHEFSKLVPLLYYIYVAGFTLLLGSHSN